MKTTVKSIIIALFTLTIFIGCKKEPILPMQTENDGKFVQPPQSDIDITKGQWIVSLYEDGTQFKPSRLSYLKDYVITFNSANVVFAAKNNKTIIGKWTYITNRISKYLVIDFGVQPLVLMNNKWETRKESLMEIELRGLKDGVPVYMNLKKYTTSDRPL